MGLGPCGMLHSLPMYTFAMTASGMLVVPILSIINYRAQLQSTRRQGAATFS